MAALESPLSQFFCEEAHLFHSAVIVLHVWNLCCFPLDDNVMAWVIN